MESLLSPRETAALIRVSIKTLDAWRGKGGGPPYIQISARCVRYRPADVNAWLTARDRTSTTDAGQQSSL